MAWREQFDPNLDFPASVAASAKYFVCSTPRSGSHFLGQLLFGTGAMGCPLEFFNPGNLVHWQERARVAGAHDLMHFLMSIRTSPNGCFGMKAHFPHLEVLGQYMPLTDFLTGFAHVQIVRGDLLAQAISYARAQQTGDWISRAPTTGRPAVYDARRIRRCLIEIVRQNASWDHLFSTFGLRRHVVKYELLATDPPRVVHEVADFVGVTLPTDTSIPGPRTARQRDVDSESWRDRFIGEMESERAWADLEILQQVRPPDPRIVWRELKRWLQSRRPSG